MYFISIHQNLARYRHEFKHVVRIISFKYFLKRLTSYLSYQVWNRKLMVATLQQVQSLKPRSWNTHNNQSPCLRQRSQRWVNASVVYSKRPPRVRKVAGSIPIRDIPKILKMVVMALPSLTHRVAVLALRLTGVRISGPVELVAYPEHAVI